MTTIMWMICWNWFTLADFQPLSKAEFKELHRLTVQVSAANPKVANKLKSDLANKVVQINARLLPGVYSQLAPLSELSRTYGFPNSNIDVLEKYQKHAKNIEKALQQLRLVNRMVGKHVNMKKLGRLDFKKIGNLHRLHFAHTHAGEKHFFVTIHGRAETRYPTNFDQRAATKTGKAYQESGRYAIVHPDVINMLKTYGFLQDKRKSSVSLNYKPKSSAGALKQQKRAQAAFVNDLMRGGGSISLRGFTGGAP